MLVAPSILSADFSQLLTEVKEVESYGADLLHIDVMDGHFVPNITIGPDVYRNLKGQVNLVFDVHLMIERPMFFAKQFIKAGADIVTFHYEAVSDVAKTIRFIRNLGSKVGISIRPKTDVVLLEEYLDDVDIVLVMSVEPGFSGQTFMESALDKIRYLSDMKKQNNYHYLIEVDGGINEQTAVMAKEAGADILVAGTYIFKAADRKAAIEGLKKL
ncbi:MAG: ribulose-phosphate 3-epimerase [Bacilli bacterium]|nr:ribulose-phosphate 3-epimerase [Bacilli bacterium]MDD4388374.1 ribulose-phosphate 3-epimerase [Bacilli bacterium]